MRKIMRKINFPAPRETDEPTTHDMLSAALKVSRAGAPRAALQALLPVIPVRFADMPVPRKTAALEAARRWWPDMVREKPALVLLGPTGLGKSTAAACVALEFARTWGWNSQPSGGPQRQPLVWLQATELVRLQEWSDEGRRQVDEAKHARLLVVDDAGHEGTKTGIQALVDLLMSRCDDCRATVLSANLRGAAFRARYTEPLADRLRACGYVPEIGGHASIRSGRQASNVGAGRANGRDSGSDSTAQPNDRHKPTTDVQQTADVQDSKSDVRDLVSNATKSVRSRVVGDLVSRLSAKMTP